MAQNKIVGISVKFSDAMVIRMRREVAKRMMETGQRWSVAELIREAVDRMMPQPPNQK